MHKSLFIAFVALLVFTACSSSVGGDPGYISGQVVNYKGATTFIEAYTVGSYAMKVGTGVIDSGGEFNIDLKTVPSGNSLDAIKNMVYCSDLDISNEKLKTAFVSGLMAGGNYKSNIIYTNWNPVKTQPDTLIVNVHIYADRAATIKGSCQSTFASMVPLPSEFDLNLKKGWNIFEYQILTEGDEVVKALYTTRTSTGLNWYTHQISQ